MTSQPATWQPRRAQSSASSRPIPEPAPVTTATAPGPSVSGSSYDGIPLRFTDSSGSSGSGSGSGFGSSSQVVWLYRTATGVPSTACTAGPGRAGRAASRAKSTWCETVAALAPEELCRQGAGRPGSKPTRCTSTATDPAARADRADRGLSARSLGGPRLGERQVGVVLTGGGGGGALSALHRCQEQARWCAAHPQGAQISRIRSTQLTHVGGWHCLGGCAAAVPRSHNAPLRFINSQYLLRSRESPGVVGRVQGTAVTAWVQTPATVMNCPFFCCFFAVFWLYLSPFYLYTQKEGQIASPFASPLLALFPPRPKGQWHGFKPLEPLFKPFSKGLSPMATTGQYTTIVFPPRNTIDLELSEFILKTGAVPL